ncbi:hypothetical protein [Paraburkholderia dipogonis]|uniref:hypothetical protein n=1 Tax=Paraburkholderia dipogonis TaxID=1211383 RepID=UPI001FCA681E|nr:hypothetical protein [Paraburkholderia dipogonis]
MRGTLHRNRARHATRWRQRTGNRTGSIRHADGIRRCKLRHRPERLARPLASSDTTTRAATLFSQLAANVLSIPADGASVNDFSLDDQMLSQQRGGAVGMVMVAATPQLMRGNGGSGNNVTLWDEIAPPSPLPIPIDAARAAQGNVANYQRK